MRRSKFSESQIVFVLKQEEFIAFADGRDNKVQFKLQHIQKEMPHRIYQYSNADLQLNFERIY